MKLPNKDQALEQLHDFGLVVQHLEVDTHSIRRVSIEGKKGRNKNGYYRAYSIPGTDLVAGVYGDWTQSGQFKKFVGDGSGGVITEQQKFRYQKQIKLAQNEVEDIEPDLSVWGDAEEATDHPYLKSKGVKAYGLRILGDMLLLPQRNRNGELVGMQRIFANGFKAFMKSGKPKGAFHTIEGDNTIALVEGYATGATIHEATGWTVIVCFTCHNIKNVAGHFKTKPMIICGDNDKATIVNDKPANPGREVAEEVAKKYFCPFLLPYYEGKESKDFNDLGLDMTKSQLDGKAPIPLLSQVEDLPSLEQMETFLMDRKTLLADYPSDEFSFLKSRLKALDINKGFMDDIIKGILSEETILIMEGAKEELEKVRFDEKNYYKLDNKDFYPTSGQEITLLLGLASNDCNIDKQKILNDIHKNKRIGEIKAEPIPFGESHIEEFLGQGRKMVIKKFVSIQESLESIISELDNVTQDERFISSIVDNYPEVMDILEACLARKFCESKKAFVYLNCETNYGKNFFFDIKNLSRYFLKSYDTEEFRGNDPEDFIKQVYFFVDEADKFPAHYKTNEPPYKQLYKGLTTVKLGMRVLACANPISDIEQGIDPQLKQRIITIQATKREFSHCGIERVLSKKIWDKYVINRLSNKLNEWSINGNFYQEAEKHFEGFLKKYDKTDELKGLDEVLGENLAQLFEMIIVGEQIREFKTSAGFDFSKHMDLYKKTHVIITSPKKFISELFKYFDESRYSAFKKQFNSLESYNMLPFCEKDSVRIGNITRKGILIDIEKIMKVTKNENVTK